MRIRNEMKQKKHERKWNEDNGTQNPILYLFVSRRTEEVYTQTIDTHVHAHTHTYIQPSQLDFHRCLFKQCEWRWNSVIIYKQSSYDGATARYDRWTNVKFMLHHPFEGVC